jgi:hypothetical protein
LTLIQPDRFLIQLNLKLNPSVVGLVKDNIHQSGSFWNNPICPLGGGAWGRQVLHPQAAVVVAPLAAGQNCP